MYNGGVNMPRFHVLAAAVPMFSPIPNEGETEAQCRHSAWPGCTMG